VKGPTVEDYSVLDLSCIVNGEEIGNTWLLLKNSHFP
jgi:hypothetical protein